MADVDENDVTRVLGFREVGFGDTPSEGDSGGVVDEAEDVEVGNLGGIKESSSLYVSVPTGNGYDNIADTDFELVGGDVPKLAEVGTDELGGGECFLLAEVVDLKIRKRTHQ